MLSRNLERKAKNVKLNLSLALMILSFSLMLSCARKETVTVRNMPSDIRSFRALAHVVADKGNVKWASNVTVSIRQPDSLRMEALERLTDVVAIINVNGTNGYLEMPLQNERYEFSPGRMVLPLVGEVDIDAGTFAELITGRPSILKGGAQVSKEFHSSGGSYFLRGAVDEIEVETNTGVPLVYTRFTGPDKKRVFFEADFDDYLKIGSKKYPKHVVIRFENPKLLMEIKYKEIKAE